jgi:AcrR family transcriptional regulator
MVTPTPSSPISTKDELYWKILNTAVALEAQKGHLKWTVTDLAKKSRISRTLIYYYFGKSKAGLIQEAISTIGKEVIGLSEDRLALWRKGEIFQSFIAGRNILKKNPALLHFYIRHRASENDLGKQIRGLEAAFLAKLKKILPGKDTPTYESLFALYFGIGWFENLSDAAIQKALEIIQNGVRSL